MTVASSISRRPMKQFPSSIARRTSIATVPTMNNNTILSRRAPIAAIAGDLHDDDMVHVHDHYTDDGGHNTTMTADAVRRFPLTVAEAA
ncbi:hypothetical protein E2562_035828 [Oryza meyeriana var. granulata]|uniref:Uncharacterized protein n=1 Tax=Oryza meyeriana var. granulata TaxID=110450 RepID=A0A6G1D9H6_9ORYZ|nr:hypothetical protein E2562_035828 [Oryza meyeriana var. granulata]